MRLRLCLVLVFLILNACATAPQVEQVESEVFVQEPIWIAGVALPHGTGLTIDDFLFIPSQPIDTAPVAPADPHLHDNVWERLTHSFALPGCDEREISRSWSRWYAERPDYMARVFRRAQPWIHYITEQLEARDLPGELALLPIVESAYDPFAYSHGAALGTWQFIASTGRHYGLQQDWWYEGRRDVWASTQAALDYLEFLGGKFDGDWLLALAGYNSGENRVARLVAKNQAAGRPADFWILRLPRETRGYVPKLLGLSCLIKFPERYDFTIPPTPDQAVIAVVDPGAQVDLVLVSQLAEVDIGVLFSLNPGYNRWATSPAGPYHVVLPIENARNFEQKLGSLDVMNLMKWDQVTVEPGDSLSRLARIHHVPVSVIKTTNGLDNDMIRAGQKLRLPRDEQLLIDPLYAAAAAELQRLQSGLIAADRIEIRVRNGESLSVIAQRYGVSVRQLQNWNKISNPDRLRVGQKLVVFKNPAPTRQNTPRSGTVQYTVQNGDSLWSIARKHRIKLNDLMRWNGLAEDSVIRPGQSLKIVF